MGAATLGLLILGIGCVSPRVNGVLQHIDPRVNLWVMWANQTNTNSFCLALASAADPFRTCLIGIPSYNNQSFAAYSVNNCTRADNSSQCTALLLSGLNVSLPWDPQEIESLGSRSLNVTANETGCILLGNFIIHPRQNATWLTPKNPTFNIPNLCGQYRAYGWGSNHV